jgi:hypothetical protein
MHYASRENDTQILFYDTVSTAQLILSWMIWRYSRLSRWFILVACYSLYTRQKLARIASVRTVKIISNNTYFWAHLIGRAIQGVGLRPLLCWDCGFAGGHGCLSCERCVLSGSGLCVGLITCPEKSYREWCVFDREASTMKRPWPTRVSSTTGGKIHLLVAAASKKVRGRI